MKKLLFFIPVLLLSCTANETCREKTVGDYTWIQDSGDIPLGQMYFRKDDSVIFSFTNNRYYSFDEDCNGFSLSPMVYTHWDLIVSGNNLHMKCDTINAYFHRQ